MGSPAVGSPEWLVAVYPRILAISRTSASAAPGPKMPPSMRWRRPSDGSGVPPQPQSARLAAGDGSPLHLRSDPGRHARGSLPAYTIDGRRGGRGEAIRAVWEGLQQLPEQGRAILEWYYFEGLTDEQIGLAIFTTGTPQARGQKARKCRLKAKAQLRYLLLQMSWRRPSARRGARGAKTDYRRGNGPA